jgi:hypothetical protein
MEMTMKTLTLALLSSLLATACIGEIGGSGGDDDMGSGSGSGSSEPVTCDQARTYLGFDGKALEADRPAIAAYTDRMRMKPFAVLSAEYSRALGLSAFNTAIYAGTFGKSPARWFDEPAASAATVYAAFALAYDGCTQATATGADFTMAPTATIADRLCRDFSRKAWQREATDDEASTCATFALNMTNPADAPAKRWAYTCASVLSASSFLAY